MLIVSLCGATACGRAGLPLDVAARRWRFPRGRLYLTSPNGFGPQRSTVGGVAVVLVTGGGSGIGLATVTRLAAAGHRVFAASRNPTRNELPDGVTPMVLDVADPAAAEPAVAEVIDAAGRLDALVNNAGVVVIAAMEEMPDDEAHHLVEVNLFGPLRLARAAIRPMRAQGGGRIVNVTSMNDVMPAPFFGWYSASKAALWSASRALDAEVHRFGVRVSVVAPGLFRSEMTEAAQRPLEVAADSMFEPELRGVHAMNLDRVQSAGDPDMVAEAVERCITADDPPARVAVGADAESMAQFVRDTSDDDYAAVMRSFVAELRG